METGEAVRRAKAAQKRGAELMVFDWEKAARRLLEEQPKAASAGLRDDWDWTGGAIWADGEPLVSRKFSDGSFTYAAGGYTYLASVHAQPELEMDGEREPCWRYQSAAPGWGSDTSWPEEALALLRASGWSPKPATPEKEP